MKLGTFKGLFESSNYNYSCSSYSSLRIMITKIFTADFKDKSSNDDHYITVVMM